MAPRDIIVEIRWAYSAQYDITWLKKVTLYSILHKCIFRRFSTALV